MKWQDVFCPIIQQEENNNIKDVVKQLVEMVKNASFMESGKNVVTIFMTKNPKRGPKSYEQVKNRA